MMRLRPYKSCDAKYIVKWIDGEEAFAKWCANTIKYPFTEESLQEVKERYEADENGWLFTALDDSGIPVGFLAMVKADYEKNSVHLAYVIVDSSKRNKGTGKQMISLAVKYAFDILTVSRVTLKVFDNNPAAHSCYKYVGFVDEKFVEKSFQYKDEAWGCYDMAIEKQGHFVL